MDALKDFAIGFLVTGIALIIGYFVLVALANMSRDATYGRNRDFESPVRSKPLSNKTPYNRLLTALDGDIEKTERYVMRELRRRPWLGRNGAADRAIKKMPLHQRL